VSLAGVILAAGESTRMGRDKALLPWPPNASRPLDSAAGSETLLSSAIKALAEHCEVILVVAGKNELGIQPVVWGCGASLVRNPNPELGQFSSLQTGLREVMRRGQDNAMVTLVDRPPPESQTLNALVDSFSGRDHGVWAVIPEYQGKHGHPILIGREMIGAFLKAPASANAREIEHANQQRIAYVAVSDPRVTANVDTPEEYAAIGARL
jgi:molybdenum cofactor cytidylyltransferase